jgi:hypothetical protein
MKLLTDDMGTLRLEQMEEEKNERNEMNKKKGREKNERKRKICMQQKQCSSLIERN